MTTPFKPRSSLDLAERLEEISGGVVTEDEATAIAVRVWSEVQEAGQLDTLDWDMFLRTVAHTMAAPGPIAPAPAPPPYDPPKPDRLAGELLTAFADLGAELGADVPVPPNAYLVGVRGQDLMVGMPVAGRIAKGSALNLAVWLVALADPQLTRFAPMLAKVLQT